MTSEQHQFTAQGRTFPVILVRKKVKNINLHVRSDGTLYLSAPARVPWAYIEDFLEKKTDFIIRAICEMEERKQKSPMLTLSDGDTLYLAGQPYRLDVRLGLHNSIRRSGQTVFMELADDTPVTRQKLYHKLLQALGKKLFPASLSRMQPLFAGLALPGPETAGHAVALGFLYAPQRHRHHEHLPGHHARSHHRPRHAP